MSGRAGRDVEWLWTNRFPRGKVSLIVGDPDSGKSFLVLDLAARVSRGDGVPPETGLGRPGGVLLLCADDDLEDTILPRLVAAGADLNRIAWMSSVIEPDARPRAKRPDAAQRGRLLSLAHDLDAVEDAARELEGCALIVIDPVSAYLQGMNGNDNIEVRRFLWRLGEMARRLGAAVILVSHHRKAGASSVLYRTIGSVAFTAASRVVLGLIEDPAVRGRRLLLPVKANLLAGMTGRAFRITDGRLAWEREPVSLKADEMQALVGLVTVDRKAETVAWLEQLLKRGRRPSEEIQALALAEEIPQRLLWAAKKDAGIKAVRDGREGRWYWEPRQKTWQETHLWDPEEDLALLPPPFHEGPGIMQERAVETHT